MFRCRRKFIKKRILTPRLQTTNVINLSALVRARVPKPLTNLQVLENVAKNKPPSFGTAESLKRKLYIILELEMVVPRKKQMYVFFICLYRTSARWHVELKYLTIVFMIASTLQVVSLWQEDKNELDIAIVDSAAVSLASLDRRACARTQIRDANILLETLVLPVSFPWAHMKQPIYQAIPRDIEDLPGLLTIDSGIPEQEAHGIFGCLRSKKSPRGTLAAATRSSDPGVVSLTTLLKSRKTQGHLTYAPTSFDPREEDPNLPGELSLRFYQGVQLRKRKRLAMEAANKKSTLVSLRLASTSSRATIFEEVGPCRSLLLTDAILPRFVQDGIRKNGTEAWKEAIEFGSYNCRQPPTREFVLNDSSSSSSRFIVGRTRLVWSVKELNASQSQKSTFRSMLTGDRIESTSSRRPLNVQVSIRLNGVLLSVGNEIVPTFNSGSDLPLNSNSLTSLVVDGALTEACGDVCPSTGDSSQCVLSTENLSSVLSSERQCPFSQRKLNIMNQLKDPYALDLPSKVKRSSCLSIVPPTLDCVTTEDGIVSVVCSATGAISWQHDAGLQIHSNYSAQLFGVSELSVKLRRCIVCWNDDNGDSYLKCHGCHVQIHKLCAGQVGLKDNWTCQTCEHQSGGTTHVCKVCKCSGGFLIGSKDEWVHSICGTWGGLDRELAPCFHGDDYNLGWKCDLCSTFSTTVVKCVAENCNVHFHPMCAVLSSASAEIAHKKLRQSDEKGLDAYWCTQYELLMMKTSFLDNRKSMLGDSITLPVAFCGYHNRHRQAGYYGLYPGGCYLNEAMRIPPERS